MFGGDSMYLGHLGRVPVYVRFDIIFALLLVYMWAPPGPIFFVILLAVFLITILIHEMGHALVATARGMDGVSITLTGLGGFCTYRGNPDPARKLMISIAGPLVNFLAAAIAWTIIQYVPIANPLLKYAVEAFFFLNLVLGILNSLPIYPLDGGQALLALLRLRIRPATANRAVLTVSVVAAIGALLMWFQYTGGKDFPVFLVLLFGFLLYQAFLDLR